jgi:hypothetical protein
MDKAFPREASTAEPETRLSPEDVRLIRRRDGGLMIFRLSPLKEQKNSGLPELTRSGSGLLLN